MDKLDINCPSAVTVAILRLLVGWLLDGECIELQYNLQLLHNPFQVEFLVCVELASAANLVSLLLQAN